MNVSLSNLHHRYNILKKEDDHTTSTLKSAPCKSVSLKLASLKSAPFKLIPLKSALVKSEPAHYLLMVS